LHHRKTFRKNHLYGTVELNLDISSLFEDTV